MTQRLATVFFLLLLFLVVVVGVYVRTDWLAASSFGYFFPTSNLFGWRATYNSSDFLYSAVTSSGRLVADRSLNIAIDLKQLGFPITNFSAGSDDRFVFVTAANEDYLHVAMDAIARIQKHFPNHTIFYYDLASSSDKTRQRIGDLCRVKYRKFDYSVYPDHVRNLHTYAFKPIIIHELLHEHSNIFWVDSSIRFTTSDLSSAEQQASNESRGIVFFDDSGHSIFAATHETTFRYLPMSKENAAKVEMLGANAIYLRCNQQMYDHVIRWWLLCALKRDCMAPTTDLYCKFNGRDHYARCHRYDQSVINILLANYFDNNEKLYSAKKQILSVERGSRDKEFLSACSLSFNVKRVKSQKYLS